MHPRQPVRPRYVDGCGATFECGACGAGVCGDGGRDCACPQDLADATANNGVAASATALGDFADAPNSAFSSPDQSIHTATDEDWYTLHVDDAGLDGNPIVTVTLDQLAPTDGVEDGSRYAMTLYLSCDGGSGNDSVCLTGGASTSATWGVGCKVRHDKWEVGETLTVSGQINCSGTLDESGVARLHVRKIHRYGRCDGYSLEGTVR